MWFFIKYSVNFCDNKKKKLEKIFFHFLLKLLRVIMRYSNYDEFKENYLKKHWDDRHLVVNRTIDRHKHCEGFW